LQQFFAELVQEDIDNLLKGVDDEPESEEDPSSLISQEDIDLLLKGVNDDAPEEPLEKEESEVVLTDDGVSGLVSQEDIDALLRRNRNNWDIKPTLILNKFLNLLVIRFCLRFTPTRAVLT